MSGSPKVTCHSSPHSLLYGSDAASRLQTPIVAEANKKLEEIRSMLESLLVMLEECVKRPGSAQMDLCHATSDASLPAITVTQCYSYQQYVYQTVVAVEYEFSESRQGFGHWVAQVQSRSTGGEGGASFIPLPCFL
jgi:hypothetical protein